MDFIQCPKVLAEKKVPNRAVEENSVKPPRLHLLKNEGIPLFPFQDVKEDADHLEPQVMHTLLMKINNH